MSETTAPAVPTVKASNSDAALRSRKIKKVAVLGSGIMGSGIACHFANIGLDVLMLDIVPRDLADDQKDKPAARNKMANDSLAAALKSRPAALYNKKFASRITTGNFDDDFEKIEDCDWIIEVVVERLDIKKIIFEKVDKFRKKGALVSSNTSGIPINLMAEGRSDDFKKHFCGTHFFNPPRYLRLLEIIPTPDTDPAVIDFFMHYGDLFLGKQTVLCKDTPAFIANRVGVYAMAKIYQLTDELGLDISTVDKLTGPAIGRPKTGTFRLGDLVGLDTAAKVMTGIKENCPNDEQVGAFNAPSYMNFLLENKFYGNKTKKGFYQKTKEKDEKGRPIILGLDLKTHEYTPTKRPNLASLKDLKQIENQDAKIKFLFNAEDEGGQLIRRSLLGLFAYVSNRIPEIADNLYSIDDAVRAGFAWEYGPFEYWDTVGVQSAVELAQKEGEQIAPWVTEMLAAGHTSFYKSENGQRKYYDSASKSYKTVPGGEAFIQLDNYRELPPVYKNDEITLHDIGEGVLCLEFTSKMNSIGEGVLRGINEKTTMRCRYSSIPVVAATQGYVFGGGCETIMHCDAAMVAAESYIGLVEVGVGLIPGGGGTKEFAVRLSDSMYTGDVIIPKLIEHTKTVAMASVSTSAAQAYDMGYLVKGKDEVVMNTGRNIAEAKAKVLELADGYTQPLARKDIKVLGRNGLGALYTFANELKLGKYASDHDIKIAKKISYVLCGGDLTGPQTVSEQYLLDIEREAFLSLCGEQKTQERIQHMLQTNKPLRN